MAIEKKEVEYAKEADDIMKLVVELVEDLRAKKPLNQVAGENLTNLMDAISGADQVDDEWIANRKVLLSTVLHRAGELTDAIIGPKKAPEVDPAA